MLREYRLIVFDVDGTLAGSTDGRVIWEHLHECFGTATPEEQQQRYEAYKQGKITYAQWVDHDVRKWIDVHVTRSEMLSRIERSMRPAPGAKETLAALQRCGYLIAIISGSLDILVEYLFPEIHFEAVYVNRLWFDQAGLIYEWDATSYDGGGKVAALEVLAKRYSLSMDKTVFVGDGINDIDVMKSAGLAVAYEPKDPSVKEVADVVIRGDMRELLEVV